MYGVAACRQRVHQCPRGGVFGVTVSVGMLSFTPDQAQILIDKAVASGIPRGDLRWCLSTEQRRQIVKVLQMISPMEMLRYEYEHGQADYGMYCGVPYVVDDTLPDTDIRLDVVQCKANFCTVVDLPVSRPIEFK